MQKITYRGNGTKTEFYFEFPFYQDTDIIVTKNNEIVTNYTIDGVSNGLNADIPYNGGTVVFNNAPTTTEYITISRELPLKRIVDYQPTEKINPTILNQDQNYTMEVLKDFKDKLDDFDEKYSVITDTDSMKNLSDQIDVLTEITNEHTVRLGEGFDVLDEHTNRLDEHYNILDTHTSKLDEHNDTLNTHNTFISDNTDRLNSHDITIGDHTNQIDDLSNRISNMVDCVIEFQLPTMDNGFRWYRKYQSGWVEQGGTVFIQAVSAYQGASEMVFFQIPMCCNGSENYKSLITRTDDPGNTYGVTLYTDAKNTTSMEIHYFTTDNLTDGLHLDWEVKGIAE